MKMTADPGEDTETVLEFYNFKINLLLLLLFIT